MTNLPPKASLADRIDQGRGVVPADLVLKGGRVFDLISGELVETDVAICGDTIVGTFGRYQGRREVDMSGKVLVPGFIDTHLHIESSLVTPFEFDHCVTPRGATQRSNSKGVTNELSICRCVSMKPGTSTLPETSTSRRPE